MLIVFLCSGASKNNPGLLSFFIFSASFSSLTPIESKRRPRSAPGSPKEIQWEHEKRSQEPKRGPGRAQEVPRVLQNVPKGSQGSLKSCPGYPKTAREQVSYSRLYIHGLNCKFIFQGSSSRFYLPVLYLTIHISMYIPGFIFQASSRGVYSKQGS